MGPTRKPITDEQKMEIRKKDRERKRRDQLTPDKLLEIRKSERDRMQNRRLKMSEGEKEKVKEKDRDRKSCKIKKYIKKSNVDDLKEIRKIEKVIRMRNKRSLLSKQEKENIKNEAKVRMSFGRKNGFLRRYKQRKTRDGNNLNLWKKFLGTINLDLFEMSNRNLKDICKKLKKLDRQIKAIDYHKKQEARKYDGMVKWNPRGTVMKKEDANLEQLASKACLKMRKHRKPIQQVIKDYEKLKGSSTTYSTYSDDSSDDDSEYSEHCEHGIDDNL